jgi:hypothetical protein
LNEKLYPVKKDDLVKMISDIGFVLKEGMQLTNTHFGLIFTKKC